MVLEARYKAEKIEYPVVWEDTKDASNVIDYNINKEITVDTNAVFNANNQTTTGMATLTPWVNIPRLLQNTSIYKNWVQPMLWAKLSFSQMLYYPYGETGSIETATITDKYGSINIYNKTSSLPKFNWVAVSASWWYQMNITYAHGGTELYNVTTEIRTANWYVWDETIVSYKSTTTAPTTEAINVYLSAWRAFYVFNRLEYLWVLGSFSTTVQTDIVITKI